MPMLVMHGDTSLMYMGFVSFDVHNAIRNAPLPRLDRGRLFHCSVNGSKVGSVTYGGPDPAQMNLTSEFPFHLYPYTLAV